MFLNKIQTVKYTLFARYHRHNVQHQYKSYTETERARYVINITCSI